MGNISYYLVTIFAIFVGSQITEGVLLVSQWQAMPADEFYQYYNEFGPNLGRYYTILTVIAALIPVGLFLYCWKTRSKAILDSGISSAFAILFILCFVIYFKGANELFYQSVLDENGLRQELITWKNWHWGRVVIELLSLFFLIRAFDKLKEK